MLEKQLPQNSPEESIDSLITSHIENLGQLQGEDIYSMRELVRFIDTYSYPEMEEEWCDTISTGYAVGKLLNSAFTYSNNEKENFSTITRRKNSIIVLEKTYEVLLQRKPKLAEIVVDSMIEKLKSDRPENMRFHHDETMATPYVRLQDIENYTLLEFFTKVSEHTTKNKDISKKAFEALIQTLGIGNFPAPGKKIKIIQNFFLNIPKEDQEFSKELVNVYLESTENIKEKYPYLRDSICLLNFFLLSEEPWKHISNEIKKETRKKIFDRSIDILKKEKDPEIRRIQILTLSKLVEIEDKESNSREKDPLIYTPEIFSAFANIVNNEIVKNEKELDDNTLNLHIATHVNIGKIFKNLYQRNLRGEEFFRSNTSEIINTFRNYVKVIALYKNPLSYDSYTSEAAFRTLESILPISDLRYNPGLLERDPYLKEVSDIKAKFYSGNISKI